MASTLSRFLSLLFLVAAVAQEPLQGYVPTSLTARDGIIVVVSMGTSDPATRFPLLRSPDNSSVAVFHVIPGALSCQLEIVSTSVPLVVRWASPCAVSSPSDSTECSLIAVNGDLRLKAKEHVVWSTNTGAQNNVEIRLTNGNLTLWSSNRTVWTSASVPSSDACPMRSPAPDPPESAAFADKPPVVLLVGLLLAFLS